MARTRLPLLFILLSAASLAALKWLPAPYLWISTASVLACLMALRTSATTAIRMLWLNLAVVAATLGGFEAWALLSPGTRRANTPTYAPADYQRTDEILGHASAPGTVARSQKWRGKTLLYDVTYTIGPDGLRVSPPRGSEPPAACVIFFGDSFIFGEGLNDTQTLPYRTGELGGGRFEVYNFGYHGYGPHQMLSALEHGRVASILKCRPTHVIYTAIGDHVARVVALNPWGVHDPRYRLEPDGSVRYDGHFDDDKPKGGSWGGTRVHDQLAKSALYSWMTKRRRPVSEEDQRLFVAIVAQSRRMVESAYPGCVFEILFWDGEPDQAAKASTWNRERPGDVVSALQQAGFAPRIVESILPPDRQGSPSYTIPHDGHPTARANDLLARYVVQSIIEASQRP